MRSQGVRNVSRQGGPQPHAVGRLAALVFASVGVASSCATDATEKKPLGQIPDVMTSAEPEWLPFAVRAGQAVPADPREKHLRELRELTSDSDGDASWVMFSIDGKSVLVTLEKNLDSATYALDLGTGARSPGSSSWVDPNHALYGVLAKLPLCPGNALEANRSETFLPDSRRVAFDCNVDDPALQIYVADIVAPRGDGNAPPRLPITFAEGGSACPAFSPNGELIAFVSRRHDHRASAPRHVFVARWVEDP